MTNYELYLESIFELLPIDEGYISFMATPEMGELLDNNYLPFGSSKEEYKEVANKIIEAYKWRKHD